MNRKHTIRTFISKTSLTDMDDHKPEIPVGKKGGMWAYADRQRDTQRRWFEVGFGFGVGFRGIGIGLGLGIG